MSLRLTPLLLVLLLGCYEGGSIFDDDDTSFAFDDDDIVTPDDDDSGTLDDDDVGPVDADGDGWPQDDDCDDTDPDVHPGAPEQCNDQDDDCDGQVDEGVLLHWYDDADGDGFGDPATAVAACEGLPGQVSQGGDCDDADPDIHPGSTQQIDGQDSDCDGRLDWLVQVRISGDDDFEWCWDDEDTMIPGDNPWPEGQLYEVWMTSGSHVVGVRGWDLHQVITAVIVHVELSDGTLWVSDASWTFDPQPEADPESRAGWCSPGFDDSPWQPVNVIGPIGTSPWGNAPSTFPAGSPAFWIWDYYPVDLNTQYVRKQIELP